MSENQQFLHSTYKKNKIQKDIYTDALMICSKDIETGEPKFTTHVNPKRIMYTVKPMLRNEFTVMKEAHHMRDLEARSVYNHELENQLAKALGMYHYGYVRPEKVLNSPYSAGNDISIDVLYKHEMNSKIPRTADRYTVGGFDIETDVVNGTDAILCISYVSDDHTVYLSILKSFLKGQVDVDKIRECCIEKVSKFISTLNPKAKSVIDKCPIKDYHIQICDTEVEQIKWIWGKVHEKKDNALSIWNMVFDMGKIIDRLEFYGVNPESVMCHPEAPNEFRVCNLQEDTTPIEKLGHITYRWDVMHLSGYTQPIDSMCLYSRLRRVEGLKSSRALGSVAAETIGSTKMDFGDDGHYQMQSERPVEYCAYNVIDSLILPIHDKVTNDVGSMFLLTENSVIPSFAKQTVQLSDAFFKYLKDRDMVPGSCKGNISLVLDKETGEIKPWSTWLSKYGKSIKISPTYRISEIQQRIYDGLMINLDDIIKNTGGGVLNPLLTDRTGVALLEESDNEVSAAMAVSDLDVASTYSGALH